MQKLSLNGNARLKMISFEESIDPFINEDFFPEGWLDTSIPEDIRSVLRRQGYISGHYFGKELDSERFIDEHDFLYHKYIKIDKSLEMQKNILHFDGIDTLAKIYLNGNLLGECENMFLRHSFDVTALLKYGELNTLVVRIVSPIKSIKEIDRTGLFPAEDTDRLLLRKSQMNYGWDFCGHCLTGGIWKDVWLESVNHDTIKDVFLHTDIISTDKAEVGFAIETESFNGKGASDGEITITFWENGKVVSTKKASASEVNGTITVSSPKLWWPRPYGAPHLYDVTISLTKDGTLLDSRQMKFGIRTIKLIQDKLPEGGRSFIFEVNSKKLFIRGANWVPINCVYSEITDEDYDFYIERAVDSNLSMLRIWGGGIYESEYFFDLCDEKGILVFEDFMLACGVLPQTQDYLDKVYEEVCKIVRLYRSRTSLAIWSADNELDQAYWWYDLQAIFKTNKVNRIAVQNAVLENDTTRPFLVSSPCSPFDDEEGNDDPNSYLQGDMHIYLTRFDKDSEYYYKKLLEFTPRFMSEYGFSSLPNISSYDKFNFFQEPLDLSKNPWLGELKSMSEIEKRNSPTETIEFTQYTHSQALKYWIEYMRCCKPTCGGTLYWKFNDPIAPNRENMLFPTMMSAIDFYRTPKLAYYYARRAYEDVILAFKEDLQGNLSLYTCNETQAEHRGKLNIQLLSFDGDVLCENEITCTINADTSVPQLKLPMEEYAKFPKAQAYIRAEFISQKGDLTLLNRFYLLEIAEWPYVELGDTTLEAKVLSSKNNSATVSVKSSRFAQDVTLTLLDTDTFFSDNSFCMDAGQEKIITIQCKNGFTEKPLRIKAHNSQVAILQLD